MSIYRRYMVGESWETEDGSSNRHAIATLRKVLLRPKEVERALASGQSPIDVSIEKWTRIQTVLAESSELETLGALEHFIGANTCGLCIDSLRKYRVVHGAPKSTKDKCSFCLLAQRQVCPDKDSIYSQIDQVVQNAKHAPQLYYDDPEVFDRLQELVLRLIGLLKSL